MPKIFVDASVEEYHPDFYETKDALFGQNPNLPSFEISDGELQWMRKTREEYERLSQRLFELCHSYKGE